MAHIYCTAQEFGNHPTGLSVQNLVAGGTSPDQTAELAVLTGLASSYVEQFCYQPLYGHTTTELTEVRPDPYGRLSVRVRHFPLVSVTAAQWRQSQRESWSSIDLTLIDTESLHHRYFVGDQDYAILSGWGQAPLLVRTTYVAGYPNGLLTSAVLAGATTLVVDDATGVGVGDTLTLWDLQQEDCTVQGVAGTTVTLAQGTQYGHAAGVRASGVPAAVTLATILLMAWVIKERRSGGGSLMQGVVQPSSMSSQDAQMAQALLQPFRRVI